MESSYKKFLKTICLSLILFLPLITHAAPTGEIIFRLPGERNELWIGNVNDGRSAQLLFKLPYIIREFSMHKDSRYIVTVVKITVDGEFASFNDVYLLDRKNPNAAAKRLTQGQYHEIIDAAVSPEGDVVFTNHSWELRPGLYHLPNHEIKKKNPIAKLVQQVDAYQVDWARHENKIAYSTDTGVFIFDIITKQVSLITQDGDFPVFSPNSKQLAFRTRTKPYKLGIISVVGPRNLWYIELEEGLDVVYLTWSADGQYLVYTLYTVHGEYINFAVQIESGRTERILTTYSNGGLAMFEWANRTYAIDPADLLTTVWGEIKQKK